MERPGIPDTQLPPTGLRACKLSPRGAQARSMAKRGDGREPDPRKTTIWRQETGRERKARPQTRMGLGR